MGWHDEADVGFAIFAGEKRKSDAEKRRESRKRSGCQSADVNTAVTLLIVFYPFIHRTFMRDRLLGLIESITKN
ncbi:hypothetical protein PO124_00680 [Bacillus licheniformis]|nr:hypothetical protein [Bacillus licheniformis]